MPEVSDDIEEQYRIILDSPSQKVQKTARIDRAEIIKSVVKIMRTQLQPLRANVDENAVVTFPVNATQKELVGALYILHHIGRVSACAVNFAKGDTWNAVCKKYGDGRKSLEPFTSSPEMLDALCRAWKECGWVANKWEPPRDFGKTWLYYRQNSPFPIGGQGNRRDGDVKPIVSAQIDGYSEGCKGYAIVERDGKRFLISSEKELRAYESEGWVKV